MDGSTRLRNAHSGLIRNRDGKRVFFEFVFWGLGLGRGYGGYPPKMGNVEWVLHGRAVHQGLGPLQGRPSRRGDMTRGSMGLWEANMTQNCRNLPKSMEIHWFPGLRCGIAPRGQLTLFHTSNSIILKNLIFPTILSY